ncbi:transcription factor GTE12-like [Chenopodium quinoa]|uniref:transcription factor GTE12-like n=1 Tax=Chenopodium quinoa TaxID=63459 RepID=UPI000B78DC2F|nr:transcription factor GTE12-like [Chenopodium quinoa]
MCIKSACPDKSACPANGIIDDASEVSSGVKNNIHVLGVCPLSKQPPKEDGVFKKSSETFNQITNVIGNKKVNSTLGLKRRSEEVIKGPVSKKLKLDRSTTLLCQTVLEKLMSNPLSNLFKVPVDPVMWNIDDYFDIIKKPMDLGTIKQKLLQHKYDRAEEFEADVRLTFSNAMLYNPPDHYIHQRASSLIRVFDRLWEHRDVRQRSSHEHNSDRPLSSSKFKCDVATEKIIPYDEFTAVKDKHTSPLQMGSFGQVSASLSFMDSEHGYASAPSTSGSFGATAPSTTSMSFMDSERGYASAPSTSMSFMDSECRLSDVELSPSRALHIAKLKNRYADTIMKAQNHTLLEPGAKTIRQREKKIMQRRQHEETANMDAKISVRIKVFN